MLSVNNDSFVSFILIFIAFVLFNAIVCLNSPPVLTRSSFIRKPYSIPDFTKSNSNGSPWR